MLHRQVYTTDDLGQRVPLLDWPRDTWFAPGDPRARQTMTRIWHITGLYTYALGFGLVLGLSIAATTAVLGRVLGPSAGGWVQTGVVMVVALLVGQVGGVFYRWRLRALAPQIASAALAEGACPSCGFMIEGPHNVHEGCVRCPKCDAGWLAGRIEEPGPLLSRGLPQPRSWTNIAFPLTVTGTDDRGNPATVLLPRAMAMVRPARGTQANRLVRAQRRGRRVGWPVRSVAASLFFVVGALALIPAFLVVSGSISLPGGALVGVLLSPLFMVALGVMVLRSSLGQRAQPFVRIYQQERLCAACGGDLTDAQPGADERPRPARGVRGSAQTSVDTRSPLPASSARVLTAARAGTRACRATPAWAPIRAVGPTPFPSKTVKLAPLARVRGRFWHYGTGAR